MASVRKLYPKKHPKHDESPWIVTYTDARGKRVQYTPGTGLKKDADAAKRRIEAEIERGEHVVASQTATVSTATDAWLRHCHERARIGDGMTKSTVEMYGSCVNRIVARVGAKKLTALDRLALQDLAEDLSKTLGSVSVAHTFTALRMTLDHAVEREWLKRNPVREFKVRLPKSERCIAVPSKEQLKHILNTAAHRWGGEARRMPPMRLGIVSLAIFCGLRRGEICALRWEDVDLENRVVNVRRSLSRLDRMKAPKSKAGVRPIPLATPVLVALQALQRLPIAETVFATLEGKPIEPNNIGHIYWRRLCARAGYTNEKGTPLFHFHALRHAAASLFIEQKLSPLHVKTVIGHASITTTLNIYGHLFPEDQAIRLAADAVANSLAATEPRHTLLTN